MIKQNIDLTSNNMFSQEDVHILTLSIREVLYNKYPWNLRETKRITSDADLRPKFEAIITGDREERNRKKDSIKMDSHDTCDRCGSDLTKIPWDKFYDLCMKCYKDLENKYWKKYPWSPDTEIIVNRNHISVFW